MSAVSDTFLQTVEDLLISVMFEDVCTVYNSLSKGSGGLGAPDGEGGYGDQEGGSRSTWDAGTPNIPCKMDTMTGGTEGQKDVIDYSKTKQVLYVPSDTVVSKTSEVATSAGNNGIVQRYQVIDIIRESGQTDIGLVLESRS